jgi:Putative cyclase
MSDFAMSEAEFRALRERLRRASAWVPADRRGALNNITMSDVVAAAGDVRVGRTVSLAAPIQGPAADNPDPAVHQLAHSAEGPDRASGLSFATDRLALNIHGDADSHMDALCHVLFDGALYNGVADDTAAATGAAELSIDVVSQGIAGRGLLLDIPRVRRVPWLEPGDHVTADDLLAAESAQADRISQGDLVFVRVGHRARRRSVGPWDAAGARAGLHPAALELLAQRRIGVLGDQRDGPAPARLPGIRRPGGALRGAPPLVVPVRPGAAAAARRDRLPHQPNRDLLKLQARYSPRTGDACRPPIECSSAEAVRRSAMCVDRRGHG